jgi:NAD(P)-dependent dehydrogenase (short-subunit alcohol dehydrogenase family)
LVGLPRVLSAYQHAAPRSCNTTSEAAAAHEGWRPHCQHFSGLARFSIPGTSAYGAAKGAIEVLTRYLAKELGARGITANVVAPGAIETDFSGGMVRDNPEINKQVAAMTALGRVGVPDDIGPMIAALLSDDNRWVNGQRIEVSGGMSL